MAGRRGNNEGSISQRPDRRWEARITLEGNRRKSFYGKTRQDAARKLTEALRDRDKGLPIVGDKQTLGKYLESWFEQIGSTVGPTTLPKYTSRLRLHVVPTLGNVPLSKLTAQHLQSLYAAKLKEGLSPTTVNWLHGIIKHALNDAYRLGVVQRNIAAMVDPPRKRKMEIQSLTPAQTRVLVNHIAGDKWEPLLVLALTTGMREGEIFGLRWSAVNLDDEFLQVRASLKRLEHKLVAADLKTKHSRRRIALTPRVIDLLRRHHAQQMERQTLLGPDWHDCGFVFAGPVGKPLSPSNFESVSFKRILSKCGLPDIRFHDLRHTAATLMLLKGVHPKVVSEILGHASIAITLDLYSHVLPDMQSHAVQAMAEILEPS